MHYFGSYLGSGLISYAANEQNEITFDAKILDEGEKEVNKTDITSELNLRLNIAVKEGSLKNIKLNLENCNFKLKDEITIDQINAGENKELNLPIVARNDNKFNLDLLNMESKIKLTGTYSNDNKTEEISKEKSVSLEWNSEKLQTMDDETKKATKILENNIITNKIYTIDGEEKRVVQVKIKSGIKDNIYPIEKTQITVNPIQIGTMNEEKEFLQDKELRAEKVEVTAYSTMATNGKDGAISFGTAEENKLGSWQYDSESGKITITVNNSKDENNCVEWAKNAVDEFVVTYIFDKEAISNTSAIKTEVENNIKLYTDEAEHKKTARYWETNAEKAMLVELDIQAPEKLSKRNIKTGVDFNEYWTLNISSTKIGEDILAVSQIDNLNIADQENQKPVTYYNATYINKDEFIDILGEDGTIDLINIETEEQIGTITIDSVAPNNETLLTEEYPEDVSLIGVQISKPIKAGKLRIASSKTLDISNVEEYVADIDKIESLTINAIAGVQDNDDFVYTIPSKKQIKLEAPKTNAELGLNLGKDKTTLPVGEENKVDFTVTLLTEEDSCKLFNNPEIKIQLPENVNVVQEIKKENVIIQHANGLEIESVSVQEIKKDSTSGERSTNKQIEIKLKGNQEGYAEFDGQNTTITFSANLKTPELLPTSTGDIKLTVVNGEEEAKDSEQVTFSAEKGIILANSISNYNEAQPEIVAIKGNSKTGLLSEEKSAIAQVTGTIINNTGKDLENVVVTGNFAEAGSTINPTLKEEITAGNATVEYFVDGQTFEAYNPEKANEYKSYKITFAKLTDKTVTTFTYKIEIPANLGANKSMESTYTVKIGNQEGRAVSIKLETSQKVELELKANPTNNVIYEGQEVAFTLDVTNKSNVTAKNVNVEVSLPEELDLVSKPENFDIEAGKTITKTITAKVKELPEETKQKDITTTIKITPNGEGNQAKTVEVKNVIKKSLIIAKIEDAYMDDAKVICEGGQLGYKTTVTNMSDETLTNVVVTIKLPERAELNKVSVSVFNLEDQEFIEAEGIKKETEKNNVKVVIPEIKTNQEVYIETLLKAGKLDANENKANIKCVAEVSLDNMENKYIVEKEDTLIKKVVDLKVKSENLTEVSRDKYVESGDIIRYTFTIKNEAEYGNTYNISGEFSDEIEAYLGKEEVLEEENNSNMFTISNNKFNNDYTLNAGETLQVTVEGKIKDIENRKNDIEISAIIEASILEADRGGFSSTQKIATAEQTIKYTLKKISQDNPEKPENPDEPQNPDDPEDPAEKTYSISGTAWLDKNEDGIKGEKEKLLKGILVKIKQINKDNIAEYLKGEDGKEITAITDNDGKYEFKNLKAGKYIIEFEYNTKTYKLTPVVNKDSVPSAPTTNEGTTVTTDTLNLVSKNIENINIGLVLNAKFDLELNKYITRVVVQNNSGTTEYKYNNEQLAKVEIKAKQMASSTVFVEYQIEVKNNGAVPGTASVIADYLPKGLKFSSEMNTIWYQGTDGNLYTEALKDVTIEPGESKQVKLILTKAMTANNTGTFTNAAEIYEDKNDFGLVDTNSKPANQEQKENDYSTAELLISTATGSPAMYIGIIVASMIILGGGIYLINKKVINRKNFI